MGIKHSVAKAGGQKGFAAEWNANHVIDGDTSWSNNKITSLKDPTLNQDAATKKYVDDTVPVGGDKCLMYDSGAQVIAHATNVEMTADSEDYDTNNMHDPIGAPTRIVIKTAGYYLVFGKVRFVANAVGTRQIRLQYQRAAAHIKITEEMDNPTNDVDDFSVSKVLYLEVDDEVYAHVVQKSGGNLNTVAGVAETYLGVVAII